MSHACSPSPRHPCSARRAGGGLEHGRRGLGRSGSLRPARRSRSGGRRTAGAADLFELAWKGRSRAWLSDYRDRHVARRSVPAHAAPSASGAGRHRLKVFADQHLCAGFAGPRRPGGSTATPSRDRCCDDKAGASRRCGQAACTARRIKRSTPGTRRCGQLASHAFAAGQG